MDKRERERATEEEEEKRSVFPSREVVVGGIQREREKREKQCGRARPRMSGVPLKRGRPASRGEKARIPFFCGQYLSSIQFAFLVWKLPPRAKTPDGPLSSSLLYESCRTAEGSLLYADR